MKIWGPLVVWFAILTAALSAAAQAPVLSTLEAPYSAIQSQVTMAGQTYGPGTVAYGPAGTPLVLSGSALGDSGTVWFVPYKNGAVDANTSPALATVTLWSASQIILQSPSNARSGLVEVVVGNNVSNGLPFVVTSGAYGGSCPSKPATTQLQITTDSLPSATVSQAYTTRLAATGGSGSYTWSLASGSLQSSGLSLSSSGVISGTPSSASAGGQVTFTVQVVDTSTPQLHDEAVLSVQIAAQSGGGPSAALYSFSIQASGGGAEGYDPVSNVTGYTDSVNGSWSFSYDSLNRLATATGRQANNPYPDACWQYDNFGNRLWQTTSATAYSASQNGGPNTCPVGSGPSWWAQYGTSNTNRIDSTSLNPNQAAGYDAGGDVTNDGINSYLYDGEGRVCAMQQSISGLITMTQYLYDAEGHRVAKGSISSFSCDTTQNGFTATNVYVLGLQGEQLTEMVTGKSWQWDHSNVFAPAISATYDADPTGQTEGPMYFHLSDWLGTRRQQTDYAGNPVLNFTGMPYGDGLGAFALSNTDAPDATEHHFTGKERDSESGNDYFGARYYGSSMGRFMTPDPMGMTLADPTNPQSLNLYSYVLNNPLTNIDPTGLDCVQDNGDGTVTTNTGDCANENEAAANAEHYINCDGCTSGAAGANLDAATGSLYLTDANGNGIGGTTVSDFADPQGTPGTNVTVNGSAPYLDTISGYGILPDIDSQRLQQLATGITLDSQHSFGCIANAYGIGAPGESARYLGQPVANTKRFITPGTSIGTSPLSDLARGLPRVSGSFLAPVGGPGTGRAFQMARTGSLGVAAARYAPFVGLAADAVSVGQLYNCLGH